MIVGNVNQELGREEVSLNACCTIGTVVLAYDEKVKTQPISPRALRKQTSVLKC